MKIHRGGGCGETALDGKYRRGHDENATRVISRRRKSEVAPGDSLSKCPRSDT